MINAVEYNIFGSHDSIDIDIMFKVDSIPSLGECKQYCNYYDEEHSKTSPRAINSNLCVVVDGIVVDVFKGTVDEVNNMLFYTYDRHQQIYPRFVTRPVPRDIPTKANRALRGILSHLSKTTYREIVKAGLRGSMADRIDAARRIDFSGLGDFNSKNEKVEDYYKILAFQIGQTTGLFDGMEFYSKMGISAHYPYLTPLLYREKFDYGLLNYIVDEFLDLIESRIDNRDSIYEVLRK